MSSSLYPFTVQPSPYAACRKGAWPGGLTSCYRHVGLGGMITFIYTPIAGRCDVETYSADLSELWGSGNYRESDIGAILGIHPPSEGR